jgi:hypothetical protein
MYGSACANQATHPLPTFGRAKAQPFQPISRSRNRRIGFGKHAPHAGGGKIIEKPQRQAVIERAHRPRGEQPDAAILQGERTAERFGPAVLVEARITHHVRRQAHAAEAARVPPFQRDDPHELSFVTMLTT